MQATICTKCSKGAATHEFRWNKRVQYLCGQCERNRNLKAARNRRYRNSQKQQPPQPKRTQRRGLRGSRVTDIEFPMPAGRYADWLQRLDFAPLHCSNISDISLSRGRVHGTSSNETLHALGMPHIIAPNWLKLSLLLSNMCPQSAIAYMLAARGTLQAGERIVYEKLQLALGDLLKEWLKSWLECLLPSEMERLRGYAYDPRAALDVGMKKRGNLVNFAADVILFYLRIGISNNEAAATQLAELLKQPAPNKSSEADQSIAIVRTWKSILTQLDQEGYGRTRCSGRRT